MGKLRDRVIAEQRVYEDPKHPETSNYDEVFPRTVTPAVVDPKTGEKLDKTVARIGKTADDALKAAKAAQKTLRSPQRTAQRRLSPLSRIPSQPRLRSPAVWLTPAPARNRRGTTTPLRCW